MALGVLSHAISFHILFAVVEYLLNVCNCILKPISHSSFELCLDNRTSRYIRVYRKFNLYCLLLFKFYFCLLMISDLDNLKSIILGQFKEKTDCNGDDTHK